MAYGAPQSARAGLAGRAADATKRAPYTAIFPDGIGYYTASPPGEQARRYGELQKRLEPLPANDEVRTVTVANIAEGLKSYEAGQKAVTDARTESNLARTALSQATEAWVRQLERAYGALVQELGRQRAETFFPRMNHGNGHSEGPAADAKPA